MAQGWQAAGFLWQGRSFSQLSALGGPLSLRTSLPAQTRCGWFPCDTRRGRPRTSQSSHPGVPPAPSTPSSAPQPLCPSEPQPLNPGALTRDPGDGLQWKLPLTSQGVFVNRVPSRTLMFFNWQVEIQKKNEKNHQPVLPTAWSVSLSEAPNS